MDNSLGPMYLSELLTSYVPSRELRSKSQNLLAIPETNLNIGKRSFSVCGPYPWNSLPLYLRQTESLMSFKSGLKHSLSTRSILMSNIKHLEHVYL